MHHRAISTLAAGVLLTLAVGCEPPTVHFRHAIGTLPLDRNARNVAVGDFEAQAGPHDAVADHLTSILAGRLGESDYYTVTAPDRADLRLGGDIHIEATDVRGRRTIRHWVYGSNPPARQVVPTLIRRVEMRVAFAIANDSGKHLGAVEVRRFYDSTTDPTVRGELGLARPDDPDRVPETETIVRNLLDDAADEFLGMFEPVWIEADVKMRPAKGKATRDGFAAARRKDYAEAADQLADARADAPDDPAAALNLAVAEEAAERFERAMVHYAAAAKASTPADDAEPSDLHRDAKAGLLRVSRVLQRDIRDLPKLSD